MPERFVFPGKRSSHSLKDISRANPPVAETAEVTEVDVDLVHREIAITADLAGTKERAHLGAILK